MAKGNAEFFPQYNAISLKMRNQGHNGEQERKKNNIGKLNFRKWRENFRILGENTVWLRVKMTEEYAEFYWGIQLDSIEELNRSKNAEKSEKMAFKSKNLRNWEKI